MNRLPLLSVIQVLFGFALESQNYPAQILTSLTLAKKTLRQH
jgi:hypothetical protein